MSFIPSERLAAIAADAEEIHESRNDTAIVEAFVKQHAAVDRAYAAYVAEVVRLDTMIEADGVAVQYSIERDAEVVRFSLSSGLFLDIPVKAQR